MMKTRTQELYEASQHEQMLKRVAQEGAREKWRLDRSATQGHIVDGLVLALLIGTGWALWQILRLTCKGLYLAGKYVIARFRNHPVSP
jgi:hypothetical protein